MNVPDSRPSIAPDAFEHAPGFDAGDAQGGLRLGRYEAMYEEIFAEVIEDGVITLEERERLDRAADAMGLDKERLRRLEAALQAAWEAHHQTRIVVHGAFDDEPAPVSIVIPAHAPAAPIRSDDGPLVSALRARIASLEARVRALETELEAARNDVSVEVDLGGIAATSAPDDPVDLQRRIRQDPTDPEPMHLLYRWASAQGDPDKQWCVASALVALDAATGDQRALFEAHRRPELPKPRAAIDHDAFRRLVFHPDEELLVGDIFSVITSAVLLGRVSALRRDKLLPKLDPTARHDPATSTVSAVRAIAWSAAILGLRPPPIYVDPERDAALEILPGVPPNVRAGARLLRGRTPLEVAFECGRALAGVREEHFVRVLFPGVPDLEDLFLAALSIANPALPIPPHAKARVAPIAAAIEPVLEPAQIDRLRGCFFRFVEGGGRTNLQRWAHGVDHTLDRAGLALCGDLATAIRVAGSAASRADLLVYVTSDRYFALRRHLGIAIDPAAIP
jgi:hypothetical protein